MISQLLKNPFSYMKYIVSQHFFRFKRYLLPKNRRLFISNPSVCFHGNTAALLGNQQWPQLTVEFLNLLQDSGLVCSLHQTNSPVTLIHEFPSEGQFWGTPRAFIGLVRWFLSGAAERLPGLELWHRAPAAALRGSEVGDLMRATWPTSKTIAF